jgi:hypothetical protein
MKNIKNIFTVTIMKGVTPIEIDLVNIPKINYKMTYGSVPDNFYERSEMQRLIKENAEIKKYIYETTGKRWGDDLGPGKYSKDGKHFSPLDVNERKIGQLQVCMNVMANCISEFLAHLKKCALPYMEAYSKDNKEQVALHHKAFMPNHVKSLITFQKYIEEVMKDATRDPDEFEKRLFEFQKENSLEDELEASYKLHYQIIPEIELERMAKEQKINTSIPQLDTSTIRAQPIRIPASAELD